MTCLGDFAVDCRRSGDTLRPVTNAPANNPRPIVAAIAVVAHEGKLLLVRRANPPDAGYWGFPGGKLGFGEGIAEAAVRELKEETGVVAQSEEVLTALDAFDRRSQELRAHYVLVAVGCRYVSGEPVAADDALEARWVAWQEIESGTLQLSQDVARVAARVLGKSLPPER